MMSIALARLGLGLHHELLSFRTVSLSAKRIADLSIRDRRSIHQKVDIVQQAK